MFELFTAVAVAGHEHLVRWLLEECDPAPTLDQVADALAISLKWLGPTSMIEFLCRYLQERDVDLDMPTAWSGFVHADTMLDAHTAIKAKLNVDKMPSNTLVQSQRDIINGVQPTKLKRSTKTTAKVKSKPKAFEDVGMTFDQAEALLKQFGLK